MVLVAAMRTHLAELTAGTKDTPEPSYRDRTGVTLQ